VLKGKEVDVLQKGGCATTRWMHSRRKKKNNCASNSNADHFGVCSQLGGAKREQKALRDIQYMCNAPTGVKGQTLAKRVRLLGKSTRSYGKPK